MRDIITETMRALHQVALAVSRVASNEIRQETEASKGQTKLLALRIYTFKGVCA